MKKRKLYIVSIVFVTALSIGTLGIAQQTPTDSPVTLELKLREGDQFTQKINIQVSSTGTPGQINTEGFSTLTVSNISEDGIINLIGTIRAELIGMGEVLGDKAQSFAVITQRARRDGSVISTSTTFALTQELSMTYDSFPLGLPSKPVNIGDSWAKTFKDEKVGNLKATYTLAGVEKQKGYHCAKITGVIGTYNMEGMEAAIEKGEYLAHFAVEEGLMVMQKVVTKTQATMHTGEQISSTIDFKEELINKKRLTTAELQNTISSLEMLKVGLNHLNKREYHQAKSEFQKFLSTYPDSPWYPDVENLIAKSREPIHSGQLRRLRQEDNLDELLTSAQEVIKSGSIQDKLIAYRELIRGFLVHDKLSELIPVFQETVKEHPTYLTPYRALGQLYRLQGNYAEAIKMYEKCVELSPNNYYAYRQLAELYRALGMLDLSISAYKKMLNINPNEELYTLLAKVYINSGRREESQKFAEDLKQQAGSNAYMHTLLGKFYAAIGQQDESVKAYEKAVELVPNRIFLNILKRVYEQAGKFDFAAQVNERIKSPPRPAGTGSILGTVTDTSSFRNPMGNARVQYVGSGSDNRGEVMTDETGDFEIVGLQPGRYILNVNKTGYVRRHGIPATVVANNDSVVEIKMLARSTRPQNTTSIISNFLNLEGDRLDSTFLQIRSSGAMSIGGKTTQTLDDLEEFLAINETRIDVLIIQADKDTKHGIIIDAMERAKRRRIEHLAISVFGEEISPPIRVKLPPRIRTAIKPRIRPEIGQIRPETGIRLRPEIRRLRPEISQKALILRIANPGDSKRFGTVILNDEIVDIKKLTGKFQNAPAELKNTLMIQSERDVRHEQVYQIVGAAKRAGIDNISFVMVTAKPKEPVPRLERKMAEDEPGAIVWGYKIQIQGEVHIAEPVYHGGSLWAEVHAPPPEKARNQPIAMEQWINQRSRLKVKILDKKIPLSSNDLFKQPILMFTGNKKVELSQDEITNLKKYLVEKGGFLFIDKTTDGADEFMSSMRDLLKQALPEHPLEPVNPQHELYHNYYEMGGPPIGLETWKKKPYAKKYLEGISINGRLAVILSERTYWKALTTPELHPPAIHRFITNVIIYAVTHGSISDHSGYSRR